ncbi:hypothetical protein GCM10017044_17690 [Kordiimonas sediminis]|uniref:Ice-binding protein C-terminal domain-containing protein n=1 Tax=Kordiimonas sediminis TaxID=1735581 RepID=A0A919AS25_9PROT|nr:PEPxxWA-CTERM sorting domain-containing protein [Kordiimonas sediminis]GHF23594.1 hypothetical protein GCM10017044_17690 [Kordiimonas sediminis]
MKCLILSVFLFVGVSFASSASTTTFVFYNDQHADFDFTYETIIFGGLSFSGDYFDPGEILEVVIGSAPGVGDIADFEIENDNPYVLGGFSTSSGFGGELMTGDDVIFAQVSFLSGSANVTAMGLAFDDGERYYSFSGNIVSGVPEPSTWLMMIMGFGVVGVAVRRRRQLRVA